MSTSFFDQLNLLAPIHRALAEEGYASPTPVQAAAIPPALEGRDVLGCAQTGTGKTAAFALPILDRLGRSGRGAAPGAPYALVLAPTRELAAQIGESFAAYGRHLPLRHAVIFGGVGQGAQVRDLRRGAHVLVATPGRLLDLMTQGHVRLDRLETFVLDEADRMLDMGFLPDLKRVVAALPRERQSLFFSATLPPQIVGLSKRLLSDPTRVDVTPKARSVERIDQRVVFVEKARKRDLLAKVLRGSDVRRAVVFTRTKRGADVVAKRLAAGGIDAAAIHGNKSQNNRQRTLARFRGDALRVLVATDLAARGIDVEGVTHVVNYEVPDEPESYVHRIGRTGRAGASGVALTLCDPAERAGLRAIERLIGRAVPVHGGTGGPARAPEPVPAAGGPAAGYSSNGGRRRSRSSDDKSDDGPARRGRRSGQGVGAPRTEEARPRRIRRRRCAGASGAVRRVTETRAAALPTATAVSPRR
ncbi:MAG TPA: DEAD/DEAH box helicase [Planctomycetaceae bacterium]